MKYFKAILFVLLVASQVESVGQVFPVQSTVQLTPPYSLYLSDYAAPGSERLRVTAFLIDATRPELNVRFRLRIEGNGIKIETKPEFMPPPVTLLGGVPLQLISSDLAAYFDPRNLNFTGITQREIEQRGALPEGLYQFCFEVVEYNRGVKISNTGCAVAWLILNDPPIVNVPADNEKIRIQDPQQVIFQWTPRHRGTPNSAFNAEYDFKLVEVWPSTRNPNDAILTSPVIFQTTTSETTIIYGPAETPLEPGRRYAFQLRAHAYAGADELSLFKNNGYSQVYTFVYGDACLPPKNISVSDVGTTRFNVSWDGASNQTTYALRYRFANTGNWYTNQSLTPNVTVNSLQPNTRYEFQVNASCGTFTSDYSSVTSVTTKDNPGIQYSCGVPLTPFNLDPSQLINSLKVGDIIKAGDFDVVLSKVSGSNGTFSGEGVIEVSYFNQAKVKAEFTNINVNNEMRMVNGYMNVTGAGVEVIPAGVMNLMDNLDEALAQADKALDEYEANLPQQFDENAAVTSTLITVPGTATVTPGSNGSVVIVDGSGKRTEVPAGTTASVVDSSGKGYIIDSKGKVHTTTAAIATAAAKREYNLKLKFAEAQDQKFGFDAKRYDPIASTYTKVEDQYLSWKSVATGQLDKVLATLEGTGIDKSKIRFELNGSMVNSQWSSGSSPVTNDQSTIDLLGSGDGVESELIALYPGDKKDQVLGKLSVITYDQIVKDLVIVPVNGNKYPYSEDALRAQLNKIYGQAVVKWNITFASNFDVPGIDPFDDGGSGLLSNYSPDMRKVVNAYKANLQPNTYYLFLVKNPKSSTLAGFMPRSKECGFIFVDKNGSEESIIRTMAHELGHGAFSLRHTFTEEKNTLPQKGTDNLMDYANGTKLFKYQWDRMRYPEIVMGLFEDDKDGAMVGIVDYFAPPLTVYLSGEPFLISMKRKNLTSFIELEIEYKGRANIKSDGPLGILDRKRTLSVFESGHFIQSEYFEINKDHLGIRSISNLKERKDLLGYTAIESIENNTNLRKHEFVLFPDVSTTITLINPSTPFTDKVVVNDIELEKNTSVINILPNQISGIVLASISVEIPKDKILYVNPACHLLVTKENTRASFTVRHSGFTINYSPPLEVKVNYALVPNVFWKSTTYNFSTQSISHDLEENSYFAGVVKSEVTNSLNEYFNVLLKNAIMGTRGYDPYKDDNIRFSISQLKQNLEEDSKKNTYKPCNDTNLKVDELKDPILSSTFFFSANLRYLTEEGTGVVLKNDIPVSISFAFDGVLGKIVTLEEIKVKKITLAGSSAIVLVYKNKPQVLLENIVILPGGKVLVNDTKLVGDLAEIQNLEQKASGLIKTLLALAIYKKTGTLPVGGFNSTGSTLTGSIVEVTLEAEMRKAILDQVKANSKILGELLGDKITEEQKKNLNLMTIMGIKE